MRKVISNTTPLLALAGIGQLELLHTLYGEIIIPEAVVNEIIYEPAKSMIAGMEWIRKACISDNSSKKLYSSRLHDGEVEVMILADELDAGLLIIDDNAAKKTAKFLGYSVTGTIGVLLRAKNEGMLEKLSPMINELVANGLYLSEEVIRLALSRANEL